MVDGEVTFLTGELQPREGESVHEQIAATGAPSCSSTATTAGSSTTRPSTSGVRCRTCSAARWMRARPTSCCAEGHSALRLVDNGEIAPGTHTFHLIPADVSKARAVAAHMRVRGYARDECVAVGDSREDLDVAAVVGRLFLVANAVAGDTSAFSNVERTEAAMSEGFYEAVIRSLAESS